MRKQVFWSQKSILNYLAKHCPPNTMFSIVKRESLFFFWTQKTVLFYTATDIETMLKKVLYDVIQTELGITIKSLNFNFLELSEHKITIDCDTTNNNLIVGKFGQNRQSLVTFSALHLSNTFKTRYVVEINFPHFQPKTHSKQFSNSRNHHFRSRKNPTNFPNKSNV